MTAPDPTQPRRPGASTGALARCVGDASSFVDKHWGRAAHLHHGADVDGLLGVDEVDHILSTMALRAPAFRVVKAGATLPTSECTRTARIGSRTVTDLIDVRRVYGHFADGATIVLQGLQRYWPPVAQLCRELEDELTHPVQANAYVTPPVAQGLRVHADAHDVFALQTHGHKQWVLYEGEQSPAPDGSGGTVTLDTRMSPGDCLYLPKGCHHAARTVDTSSIHLTIGVKAVTWADVLRRAVDDAVAVVGGDPLPAGFAARPEALEAEARSRLAAAAKRLAAADVADLVVGAAQRFRSARVPTAAGQLRQLIAADDIDDATAVRRRLDAGATVTFDGGAVVLELDDRTLRLPARAEPALRTLLDCDELRPADLSEHLDEPGRVTLVRRLVREGLLAVVDG